MSVEVVYNGSFGNNVFQYICARLFAEQHGLSLRTEFSLPEMIYFSPHREGKSFKGPVIGVGDSDDIFSKERGPARYVFNGYFQKSSFYYERHQRILEFAHPSPVPKQDPKDVVAHIRLLDYRPSGIIIHPSWYLNILSTLTIGRLFIVTGENDKSYIKHFAAYNPIVITGTRKRDWNFIRSFNTILCSNSTYCWWAAFFSDASKVFTFKPWIRNPAADLTRFPRSVEIGGSFLEDGK